MPNNWQIIWTPLIEDASPDRCLPKRLNTLRLLLLYLVITKRLTKSEFLPLHISAHIVNRFIRFLRFTIFKLTTVKERQNCPAGFMASSRWTSYRAVKHSELKHYLPLPKIRRRLWVPINTETVKTSLLCTFTLPLRLIGLAWFYTNGKIKLEGKNQASRLLSLS